MSVKYSDSIFTNENIEKAILELMKRRNSCGSDGVMLHDLKTYLENHCEIIDELRDGTYNPGIAVLYAAVSKYGKSRILCRLNSIDRLIMKILSTYLSETAENILLDNCIGYRKNKGTVSCCDFIQNALKDDLDYTVRIDIADYFGSINHNILIEKLSGLKIEGQAIGLIYKYITQTTMCDYELSNNAKGLLQGSSLSPVLSNIYISELDEFIKENFTECFFRYGDDIVIFCNNLTEAKEVFDVCKSYIKSKYNLNINKSKSGIFKTKEQRYLGYVIKQLSTDNYKIIKLDKINRTYYSNWHQSGLSVNNDTYEIIENGILTSKDYNLIFENDHLKRDLPIKAIKNINIYSDVVFNAGILKMLSNNNVTLTVFDRYSRNIGRFVPEKKTQISSVFLKQCELYNNMEERMSIAVQFVKAEIFNMRTNLKYYNKHLKNRKSNEVICEMKYVEKEIIYLNSTNDLLLMEARAKEIYFSCINQIIKNDSFTFLKRTKRPPMDPINSLISFGNCVLYNHIANEIHKTALDIKIGYLHSTNRRAETLNLDIAEIYKPVIVDRVIFTLINKRMINSELHFDYTDHGVFLNTEGKRIFLKQFYNRMNCKITVDNESISYRNLIWKEIVSFKNFINGNADFRPFHYSLS